MEIFESESGKIRAAFEEASKKYNTPNDIGVDREKAFKDFLKQYLPISYRVGKGEIIDNSSGPQSASIDCIICTPYHPYTFQENTPGLFFAEGVAAVIEVKPDITNLTELQRGIKQIQSVKKLTRTLVEGCIMYGTSPLDKIRYRKIPSFLFSVKSSQLVTLKSNIESYLNSIPLEEQPDSFIILDEGIIFNIKYNQDPLHIEVEGKRKLGLVGVHFGKHTLLHFLLHLSREMPPEIQTRSILTNYIPETIKGYRIV